MCINQEEVIEQKIKVMKKKLEHLYDQDHTIQDESVQCISQKLDKLINILLKKAVKKEKN